jgi:hypothetical protein
MSETQQPANQPVELTVNDLSSIKSIIDVASSRGAFKPNEMTVVGNVYTKLETFLAAVAQQAEQQNTAEPAAQPATEEVQGE